MDGPINLQEQDLPHNSAATEWWYVNGHLHIDGILTSSPPFSFFAVFLKHHFQENSAPACAFSWAIVDTRDLDTGNGKYYTDSVLDVISTAVFKAKLENGNHNLDKLIADAILDMLKKGVVPAPDRCVSTSAKLSQSSPLVLDFGDGTFTRDDFTGKYNLFCMNKNKSMMLDLEFTPQREAVTQAHGEFVKIATKQEMMCYYSIQKLAISGKLSVPSMESKDIKETFEVSGGGWYDHVFGGDVEKERQAAAKGNVYKPEDDYAWNWFSLQLSNNMEIAAHLVAATDVVVDESVVITSISHGRKECLDLEVEVISDKWVSMRTTFSYPTKFHLTIPSVGVDLIVEAAMAEQEFITVGRPAFWEGRMHVKGTVDGVPVTGYGFLEMNGGTKAPTLQQFFKAISKEVLKEVGIVLPLNPTLEQATSIICATTHPHLMKGVDINVVVDTIIKPVRSIVDRGGKGWRSYALLLCVDSVGGNSHKYRSCMAMPEILHVGSLIIDDIQDRSELRRGGPACHKTYGEAIAINAGNAAYFIALHTLSNDPRLNFISTDTKKYFYDQFSMALGAGHTGQAMDLKGLEDLMPDAIESGDCTKLIERIECCHTLKSGVPAGALARFGATLGGGTPKQVEYLGRYLEAIGLAFQIMDDVINLRGFEENSKNRGEDITAGKITYPIALAMSKKLVPKKETRQAIFDRLRSRPNPLSHSQKMTETQKEIDNLRGKNDLSALKLAQESLTESSRLFIEQDKILFDLLEELEGCGAITESCQRATRILADAWEDTAGVLEDSGYKVLLKAFGQFVLKQYY
eukprot:Phypoly_transcript_02239.p1 GENE.Phypoly_transcript_02239~~Phypoly_transcript_02239.p1  ORF type:complete len:803 (+),score=118.41 Phypoly_transcript_02239:351-2759(+)